jgi:hypothetical protein
MNRDGTSWEYGNRWVALWKKPAERAHQAQVRIIFQRERARSWPGDHDQEKCEYRWKKG